MAADKLFNFAQVFQPIPSCLNWPITLNGPELHHNIVNWLILFSSLWRWLPLRLSKCQSPTTVLFAQSYPHPDDHTVQTTDTPGFKPFTILYNGCAPFITNMRQPLTAQVILLLTDVNFFYQLYWWLNLLFTIGFSGRDRRW